MSRKKKKGGPSVSSVKQKALAFLNKNDTNSYSIKQISRKINLRNQKDRDKLLDAITELKAKGWVTQTRDGFYKAQFSQPKNTEDSGDDDVYIGIVDFVNPRFGFIMCDELEDDIKVSSDKMNYALDGDTVRVKKYSGHKGGSSGGEVVEILKRGKTEYIGRVEKSGTFSFVVADNRKMYYDIFVPNEKLKKAHDKDKVKVEITEWPTKDKSPSGKVIQVLGPAGLHEVEMNSIMFEFGLPDHFPEKVVNDAEIIPEVLPEEEIRKRKDIRDITTFTIDPVDAKDFDDALSIKFLEDDKIELGVHIADVTHYVKPGTDLEKEAVKRATSVYLVDRVIPMLPEKLSNKLCSLRPNEDKFTFSSIFVLDKNGKVEKEWYGRTVIHSDHRFSYESAQEVLDAGEGPFHKELETLNRLAKTIREKRFKKGAIGFETTEVRFVLDDNGIPLKVVPKIRVDTHKLIEEFMLLANRKVAEFVYKKGKEGESPAMVYRVHENPDPEKLANFSQFAKKFGYDVNTDERKLSDSINKLVASIEGKPEETVLQGLAIRSMAKARYTIDPLGHFGLAFKHYTHFTSPIRRYPDMMVHRLVQFYLDGGGKLDKAPIEDQCKHSSEMEKNAADAERASIKYKQVEYIERMKQEEFNGIISGVTEWGVYVEITEAKCEGMVRLNDMTDDYYELDAENYRIIGKSNKRIYAFGDEVKVKVTGTNLDRRTIDLVFIND